MQKLLLLSLLVAVIVIPSVAARDPDPRRGFKRVYFWFAAFSVGYVLALKFVYFRLG
jgi:hypothetical protein